MIYIWQCWWTYNKLHGAIFTSKVVYQLQAVSAILCCSTAWWTSVLVYGLRNARFLLQLSTLHFKFPLWAIFLLDKKDVHLMWQHCPIHPLKVKKVHAAEHLLQFLSASRLSPFGIWSLVESVLNEAIGSVSTIKMEDPTISNFMVEKEGMVNFYQSTRCHNQDDALCTDTAMRT